MGLYHTDSVGTIYYTLKNEVPAEIVDDLCCTAFEGGITYWCTKVEAEFPEGADFASDVISRGGTVRVFDAVEEKWETLTLQKFLAALSDELTVRSISLDEFFENHDAGDADNVIQRALFGRLVYG